MAGDELDFAEECREAFMYHTNELLKVDPNEPGHRHANAERRKILLEHIDGILEQYNDWREIPDDASRLSS